MAVVHGKVTVIKVGATEVKGTTSQLERSADVHDVTVYGKDDHVFSGGLGNGTFTISGIYDNTAVSGPRAVLEPAIGTSVTLTRQPEGTGSGKAQDTFAAILIKYVETNPVADMVTWSADFQISDAINSTAQAA